jgi:hypothetical protein
MIAIVNADSAAQRLWRAHEHKRAELLGLKIDNQYTGALKIQLRDSFVTDSGYTSGGAAYSAESLISGSAVNRMQLTVPSGECISLGEEDLKGIEFLGRAKVIADTTTSNCIITAQYRLK